MTATPLPTPLVHEHQSPDSTHGPCYATPNDTSAVDDTQDTSAAADSNTTSAADDTHDTSSSDMAACGSIGDPLPPENTGESCPPPVSVPSTNNTPSSTHPIVFKFIQVVRMANGKTGMAEVDINRILQLLMHPELAEAVLSKFTNCRELECFEIEELTGLGRGWSVATFKLADFDDQLMFFRDPAQALADMFGHPDNVEGFVLKPQVDIDPATRKRRYSTPDSGTWWHEAQDFVGEDGVVAAIILYSDVTHLSENGHKLAWPVMMTLGNIKQGKRWASAGHCLLGTLPIPPSNMTSEQKTQLFQRAALTMLQGLLDGRERTPDQQRWIVKHAEDKLGTKKGAAFQFSTFAFELTLSLPLPASPSIPPPFLSSLPSHATTPLFPLPLSQPTLHPFRHAMSLSLVCLINVSPILDLCAWQCALWQWEVPGAPWANPYQAIMPDIMHQSDLGILHHIVAAIRASHSGSLAMFDG
ncbi:unnamed protein product [Closterium sp. NIES-53]